MKIIEPKLLIPNLSKSPFQNWNFSSHLKSHSPNPFFPFKCSKIFQEHPLKINKRKEINPENKENIDYQNNVINFETDKNIKSSQIKKIILEFFLKTKLFSL
jgi:hypothetical protein